MNAAVSVSQASGTNFRPNKNGLLPVVLTSINGMPLPANAGILDGSIAARLGIKVGGQYVLAINFRENAEVVDKTDPTKKRIMPNYNYALVAKLGTSFESKVADAVVASMDFGWGVAAPIVQTASVMEEIAAEAPVAETTSVPAEEELLEQ